MGYDMTWRKVDDSEEAAVRAAREAWNRAIAARDALPADSAERQAAQNAVLAASAEEDAAEHSYFRLNMRGMGSWVDLMAELGMVFNAGRHPAWPEIESFGITYDDLERVESPEYFKDEPPLDEEMAEKARRYIAERDALLAWHGPEIPGIPEHKFGSNDGWIVTPPECQAALAIYMAKLEEVGQDVIGNLIENRVGERKGKWAQWLAYLNGAVSHDGFEVH
jgi:hypothetical protein